ncbi:cupredoxin domain-containing protein [Halomonadaceae bacterium KBTZ08]
MERVLRGLERNLVTQEYPMKVRRQSAIAASLLFVSVTATAGGSHSAGSSHGVTVGEPGSGSDVDRTVSVQMHDNNYVPERVKVKQGETVRFEIDNKGALVHEFNIGTPAMHEAHQKEMTKMVKKGVIQGGELNKGMMGDMKHDDPNSVLLEPGESETVLWTFSQEGEIEFACNVPGHYQSGMHGDIEFE